MSRRQALYRFEWDDSVKPGGAPLPTTISYTGVGPWGDWTEADLLYEGPLGRTTVTVEYKEPAAKEGP